MTVQAHLTDVRWLIGPSLLAGGAAFALGLTYVGPGCDLEFSTFGWLLVVVLGGSLGLGAVAGALTARLGMTDGRSRVASTIVALVGVAVAVPLAMAVGSSIVGALDGCAHPNLGNVIPPSAISAGIGAVLGSVAAIVVGALLDDRRRPRRQPLSTSEVIGRNSVGRSRGRTRTVVSGTVLMTTVTIMVAGLGLTWAADFWTLGRWNRDLLGPASERQRIAVPERGFAISFPGSWDVDTTPPADSGFVERTGLDPILTVSVPEEASSCTVYGRTGEAPTSLGCDADHSWGVDAWDRADKAISPLMAERGCPAGGGIGTLLSGGPVSISSVDPAGTVLVGYHLVSDDREFVMACDVTLPWPDTDGSDEWYPHRPMGVDWVMQPIAATFESLPTAPAS